MPQQRISLLSERENTIVAAKDSPMELIGKVTGWVAILTFVGLIADGFEPGIALISGIAAGVIIGGMFSTQKAKEDMNATSGLTVSYLTPRQQDLIRRFYVGISLLEQIGERRDAKKVKWLLLKSITTDDSTNLHASEINPALIERRQFVFQKLSRYHKHEKLAKRLSFIIAFIIFIYAAYELFQSKWIFGFLAFVFVPIGAVICNLMFLAFLTRGFSPLALGLTHPECRFALDELIGHSRWRE
jgi:hypothetical protein